MIVIIRSGINSIKNNSITLFDNSSKALVQIDESFISRSFSMHTHTHTHTSIIMYKYYV